MKTDNRKLSTVLLVIMAILTVAELLNTVISFFMFSENFIISFTSVLPLIYMALYGFWFYKIPHGNLLKYAMLFLALSIMINAAVCLANGYEGFWLQTLRIVISGVICYAAGRLDRIEQNKKLLIISILLLTIINTMCAAQAVSVFPLMVICRFYYECIVLFTIMIAYCVRYNRHREAGISDAK